MVRRTLLAVVLLAVLTLASGADAHPGKGFRAAEIPQVKARFEAYLKATVEKRMFVRDVYIDCKGRDRMAGNRFRHIRCSVAYGAEMDHRKVCRLYHRTRSGAVISTACPKS